MSEHTQFLSPGLQDDIERTQRDISTTLEKIKQENLVKIADTGKSIFEAMHTIDILNRIPESTFVSYFIPSILGEVSNPKWISEWIYLAGTPAAPLLIHSDTDKNNILYILPGIFDSSQMLSITGRGDLKDLFAHRDLIKSSYPQRSEAFLYEGLEEKASRLLAMTNTNERAQVWIDVISRYRNITPNTASPTPAQADLDIFE